ncbi:Fic family protein [Streptomyces sp. NPDC058695]|uniref:Fic family protein n=1 Tax=Streptomyces sp. NPDC058695 TaxID=3346604 RepID=UPI003657A629
MRDDLLGWLRVRSEVPWEQACPDLAGPVRGRHDGIARAAQRQERADDPGRPLRLQAAWDRARSDAEAGRALDFGLLSAWQKLVLGRRDVRFRSSQAFAKGGRERYGLHPDTRDRFAACLAEASGHGSGIPLPARAARLYLDVSFFHPFDDGNGRAALLALGFCLASEQVFLDEAGPLPVRRYADDAAGAVAMAQLVHVLAKSTAERGLPASAPTRR